MPDTYRRVAVYVLPVVALLLLLPHTGHAASGDNGDKPSPVTLAEVRRIDMRMEVALFGSSVPWRRVQLSPMVEGFSTDVLVDAGSWVKAGEPVLELDARLADIAIDTAQARVAGALAKRSDAVRKRDELVRLKKNRHVSETALESAAAEVDIATAELARERSELARARELRDRHQVRAPFAGMITEKFVESGQWVNRETSAFELVELDTLRIRAILPQRYYPQIRAGAKARVQFDALPGRTFAGRVFARVAAGDDSSRSFPLLIDIDNREHLLAPGMSARVWAELEQDNVAVLTVPRDSIVAKSNGERVVWQVREVDETLKAFPVQVVTGRAQGERLEIIGDSLQEGDRVVLLGNESLRPGQAVADRTDSSPLAAQ